MGRCDVLKTIAKYENKIAFDYGLYLDEIHVILNASKGIAESIINAFAYGYAQGTKATKAEMKRKAKAVKE